MPQWNNYKILLYCTYIFIISVASSYINQNFSAIENYSIEIENTVESSNSGGTILALNNIQNKYGYFLAVIPKALLNLYGSVLSRTSQMIFFKEVYNDVVVWGQSFLFVYTIPKAAYIYWKTQNILASKLLYSFVIMCIIFSYIPVVQTRYFYSGYILLIAIISIKKPTVEN
ncbi:hypothetical protein GCM10027592_44790 [Spirosoma flavus]